MRQLFLIAGKYDGNNNPKGARGLLFTKSKARDIQPLIQLMREIGQKHDGKTPAQVAINWCLCKGTLPIPGRVLCGMLASKYKLGLLAVTTASETSMMRLKTS